MTHLDTTEDKIALRAPTLFEPPNSFQRFDLQRWIIRTAADLGITPTEFAKAANLAASTINRFLREGEGSGLNSKTIEALVEAANRIEVDYLSGRVKRPKRAVAEGSRLIAVPHVGRLQRAVIQDWNPMSGRYSITVPIRDPHYRQPIAFFEMADGHGGPEYPLGSLLIVAPTNHPNFSKIDLKAGDHAVVFESLPNPNRTNLSDPKPWTIGDPPGGLHRITVRKITASPDGELWATQFERAEDEDSSLRPMDYPLAWFKRTQFFLIHTVIKPV